jgi:hypothetical protein
MCGSKTSRNSVSVLSKKTTPFGLKSQTRMSVNEIAKSKKEEKTKKRIS